MKTEIFLLYSVSFILVKIQLVVGCFVKIKNVVLLLNLNTTAGKKWIDFWPIPVNQAISWLKYVFHFYQSMNYLIKANRWYSAILKMFLTTVGVIVSKILRLN